jgi:uncharacterized hydrophobic protein (TIGR00271 family)
VLQLRIVVPADRTDAVVQALAPEPGVVSLAVERGTAVKPPGDVVVADVLRERANAVIDRVCELGVDRDGSLTVVELDADRSERAHAVRRSLPGRGRDVVVWEELSARVTADGLPSIAFFCFMAVAGLIATIGIVVDSSVLIVGAMVVGPEYGPLAAFAVALYRRRRARARVAFATLVSGLLLAIVVSAAATIVFDAVDADIVAPVDRFFTRFVTEPNGYSAIVAFAAGLVGIMAIGLGRSGALTGVVVSATTIPAAAAIGVNAALGSWADVWRGGLQLAINVACLVAGSLAALFAHRITWNRFEHLPQEPGRG